MEIAATTRTGTTMEPILSISRAAAILKGNANIRAVIVDSNDRIVSRRDIRDDRGLARVIRDGGRSATPRLIERPELPNAIRWYYRMRQRPALQPMLQRRRV